MLLLMLLVDGMVELGDVWITKWSSLVVSGKAVQGRPAAERQDPRKGRDAVQLAQCLGHTLQEDRQPRQEVWLRLGIGKSLMIIIVNSQ